MSDEDCPKPSYCDGNRRNNYWVEGGDPSTGEGGVCMLDTMTREDVIYHIERNKVARKDLKVVTTNAELLELAESTPDLPSGEFADLTQSEFNKNSTPESIPFYAIFRGQPPFNQ